MTSRALFTLLLSGLLSGCITAGTPAVSPAPPFQPSNAPWVASGAPPELPGELFSALEDLPGSAPNPQIDAPAPANPSDPGERVLSIARQFVGLPYRYGGASPKGFDCSGLVYYSYRQLGMTVPRHSANQHQTAQAIPLDALRPGDLLFFKIKPQRVSHVGIFAGDDLFLHATSTGKNVTYSRLGEPYWKKRLAGAGRFVAD